MDKAALLALLARSAPMLLAALKTPYNHPGSFSDGSLPLDPEFGHADTLMEMVGNRGYDPGLIEDAMKPSLNIGMNPNDAAALAIDRLRPEMLGNATSQINGPFEGDFTSGVNLIGKTEMMQQAPGMASILAPTAENAAASMIAKGLPTDEQIVNPATGMSPLDWEWNELENVASPVARDKMAYDLARRENAKIGLQDLFGNLVGQKAYSEIIK